MEEIKSLYLVELTKEMPYLNFKVGILFEFPDTIEKDFDAPLIINYNNVNSISKSEIIDDDNSLLLKMLYNYFIFDVINGAKENDYVKLINKVEVGNFYKIKNRKINGALTKIKLYNESDCSPYYMCFLSNSNELFIINELVECKLNEFNRESLIFIFNRIQDSDKTLKFQIIQSFESNLYTIILNKVYCAHTLTQKIIEIAESYNAFESLGLNRCVLTSSAVNKCCLFLKKV